MLKKSAKLILTSLLFCLLWAGQSQARVVTDMGGRQVMAPERIERVFATAPPATYMVYALGPDLLAGLNGPPPLAGRDFLAPRLFDLPVLGGWFGQGRMGNREELAKARPDVVIAFRFRSQAVQWKIEETMEPLDLPVVGVSIDSLTDYPEVMRFLGRLFGRQERGEALARYAERTLAEMERLRRNLTPAERQVVYYAEGPRGLQTECDGSIHAELINLCGGINPHRCQAQTVYGMNSVSLEQALAYDPQVIVSHDREFLASLAQDQPWRSMRALESNKVHLIPTLPINWFDRPPTFMCLLGAHWLAHKLYPGRYQVDMAAETMAFFKLFLGVDIDRATAARLLGW